MERKNICCLQHVSAAAVFDCLLRIVYLHCTTVCCCLGDGMVRCTKVVGGSRTPPALTVIRVACSVCVCVVVCSRSVVPKSGRSTITLSLVGRCFRDAFSDAYECVCVCVSCVLLVVPAMYCWSLVCWRICGVCHTW